MKYLVTETATYIVEADSLEAAEAEFLDNGPGLPSGNVTFKEVIEREWERGI